MSVKDEFGIQGDTEALLGGAASMSHSVSLTRAFLNRFGLKHIVKHDYPFFRIGRLIFGSMLCLLINRMTQSLDHLTAIFNFYLCVSQDANALVDIKEVALGGILGTIVGGLFQAAALAATGPYVGPVDCVATPEQHAAYLAYQALLQWHTIWAVGIGLSLTYYSLHIMRLEGPDYIQVGTAVISVLAMLLIRYHVFVCLFVCFFLF
jgi:hypothetical protein